MHCVEAKQSNTSRLLAGKCLGFPQRVSPQTGPNIVLRFYWPLRQIPFSHIKHSMTNNTEKTDTKWQGKKQFFLLT